MKFSIIIPLYNKQNYICRTLESVIAQTYTDFEVIVVNDGSTDNSLVEAKKVQDNRIRIIDKENGGVSSARNRGIQEAKNEWICFFDADDIMYPHCLEEYHKLHNLFPNMKVLCGALDTNIRTYPTQERRYVISNYYRANVYSEMRTGISVVCTDCICIHRSCFDLVGVFYPQYTHGEDLHLWDRLQQNFRFAKSEVTVAYYDMGAENRSDMVIANSTAHFQPQVFTLKPSLRDPFYKHIVFGSREYYRVLAEKTLRKKMQRLFRNFGDIGMFVALKCLVRIGLIQSRGIA